MRVDFWSGLTTFVVSLLLIFWVIPAYVGRGFGRQHRAELHAPGRGVDHAGRQVPQSGSRRSMVS